MQVRVPTFNAQQQTKSTWPATTVVARAYLDQLARSNAVNVTRATAMRATLDRADAIRTGQERGAAETLNQLTTFAAELEKAAASASGRDAQRLRALAETLRGRVARLRG